MLKDIWLCGSARTPIGAFLGTLADVAAPRLGSIAAGAALARAGASSDAVDEVLFGNVISAGLGQNVARQVALGAGLPDSVGATTINKVCGSGMKAVMMAAQAIQCGDAELILAGGTENMSAAPYLLPKARSGYRLGNGELVDAMIRDGLWDVYNDRHMGACGDSCATEHHLSRKDQDEFAVASYQRAIAAQKAGQFDAEIVPVEIPGRKGSVTYRADESPAKFQEDKLRALKPAFGAEGTVTAGNASSLSDGAAAVIVADAKRGAALGLSAQARILGYASAAQEPEWFTVAPVCALERLLQRSGLTVADVDLFEINEAFAVVPMMAMRQLQIPHEKVNVHGGAIALGHPLGASGARVLVTLLSALRQREGRIGVATLCIGGGEAVAMAVERI